MGSQAWGHIFHNPLYVGKIRAGWFPDIEFELHPDTPHLATQAQFDRVARILEARWNGAERRDLYPYPLRHVLWSAEGNCRMLGETQKRKGISYYKTKEGVNGRRIYIQRGKAEASFETLLDRLTIRPEVLSEIQGELVALVGEERETRASELSTLQREHRKLSEANQRLVNVYAMGEISYQEFRKQRQLTAAALREVQDQLDALRGPVEQRLSDLQLAARLMGRLGEVWRNMTEEQDREQFARLLFKKVVMQRNGAVQGWKLAEPFEGLYKLSLRREAPKKQLSLRFPERWRVPAQVVSALATD